MSDDGLIETRNAGISGTQRLYRWGDWGLSVVNGAALHFYPFHSEAAVIRYADNRGENDFELSYATPLTNDVEVFRSAAAEGEFIERARAYFADADLDALNEAADRELLERAVQRRKLLGR